uniref:Protein kinase domain-containing protein n=1 Tax=Opuntia streptacantha TaxID=393608 RepID=A0A7C9ET65_OPUST
MNCFWRISPSSSWVKLVLILLAQANFMLSWSINDEGIALLKFRESVVNDPFGALSSWNEEDGETVHCSWFGIECSDDGHVVSLKLKNLRLRGTLASELGNLLLMKSIILRNNSFFGSIPEGIGELKELELLDLSYNCLTGQLPLEFRHNYPILLLDNNDPSECLFPELKEHTILSEVQPKEKHLTGAVEVPPYTRHDHQPGDAIHLHQRMLNRKLLDSPPRGKNPSAKPHTKSAPPPQAPKHVDAMPNQPPSSDGIFPRPSRSTNRPHPSPTASSPLSSARHAPPSLPPAHSATDMSLRSHSSGSKNLIPVIAAAAGGFAGLVLVVGIYLWRSSEITDETSWSTGLSGQLQKAFVTGIPSLKKAELETACEDFSNIIGPSSLGKIYKGTLSNGIEIAVISLPVTSAKGWSRNLERQFRKKIETLSKVNHKNFVNLIGYCEEKKPFTRMLVFEYAPNGSLFEHLHIREAEHLDWGMRLRVMMGMAYCLEHMHQLTPPRTHKNLNSSSVNLSEDYAAKISDFCVWNEITGSHIRPIGMETLGPSSATPESNVYSFGLLLLEMMTGRVPLSSENDSLESWVSGFLRGQQRLEALVDPILRHFNREQLEKISEVIRKCLHPDRKQRLTMRDVTARLKGITGIDRAQASPRLSPLWWAELGIRSVNAE